MYFYQVIPIKRMPRGIEAFEYSYATNDLCIGDLVEIPIKKSVAFGIVASGPSQEQPSYAVRDIATVFTKELLSKKDITFASRVGAQLCSSTASIIKKMLPPLQKRKLKKQSRHVTEHSSTHSFTTSFYDFQNIEERQSYISQSITARGAVWIFATIRDLQLAYEQLPEEAQASITCFHSELSVKEQFSSWFTIANGDAATVFTTRAGICIPNPAATTIYVDNEASAHHYQGDSQPKFSNTMLATYLAKHHNIPLVFTGFAPSEQTYFDIHKGNCTYHKESYSLPAISRVTIVDATAGSAKKGLVSSIEHRVMESQGVAAVILNKKGYSTGMICESCNFTFVCPTCRLPLTYHKKKHILECKYCTTSIGIKTLCPKCSSREKFSFGIGVEQIYEQLRALAKDHNREVLFIDGDTDLHVEDVPKTAILVGTSAVLAKLPWEHVSIIVLPGIDMQLQIPEYTITEQILSELFYIHAMLPKTAQIFIQTLQPQHNVYKKLHEPDYLYRMDLNLRMALLYPPYSSLVKISVAHKQKKNACILAETAASILKKRLTENNISAKISQAISLLPEWYKGRYHYAILVRVAPTDALALCALLQQEGDPSWNIEVMPNHLMTV